MKKFVQESPIFKKIFDVAKLQSGYFTSKQAQKAGFGIFLNSNPNIHPIKAERNKF